MIVGMWMTKEVISVPPSMSVPEAAAIMAAKRIRRLPVVSGRSGGEHLAGMVGAVDILRAYPPDVNPFAEERPRVRPSAGSVGEIMHRQLVTTGPDVALEEAAALMAKRKIGALPVLRGARLVGIITESDIFRALVGLMGIPGPGARVTFDMSRGEDVFGLIAQAAKRDGVQVKSVISAVEGDRPVCVARIAGPGVEAFLEDLWGSGHLVLNVLRFKETRETAPAAEPPPAEAAGDEPSGDAKA